MMMLNKGNLSYRVKQFDGFTVAAVVLFGLVLLAVGLTIAWFNGVDLWPWSEPPQSNYQKAVAEFQKAIELEPGNPEGYRWLAKAYTLAGQREATLDVYQPAIEQNPDRGWPYLELGQLYEQQGDTEQAQVLYEQAIEAEPDNADSYVQLGTFYQSQNQPEKAIQFYRQAFEIAPTDRPALALAQLLLETGQQDEADQILARALAQTADNSLYQQAGQLLLSHQLPEEALSYLRVAATFNSDDAGLYLSLAQAYRMQGDTQAALDSLQQAAALASTEFLVAEVNLERTNIYLAQQQPAEALKHLLAGIQQAPSDPRLYATAGNLYWQLGDLPQAIAYYRRAVNTPPPISWHYIALGSALLAAGDNEAGLRALDDAYALEPESLAVNQQIGQLALQYGQLEMAAKYLERVVELDPQNLEAQLELAATYLELNRTEAARIIYTAILDEAPNKTEAYLTIGRSLEQRQAWKYVVELYKNAVGQDVANADIYIHLGDAYRMLNEFDQATASYQMAAQLDPANPALPQQLNHDD